MDLFGFEIKRKEEEKLKEVPSFTPKEVDDGAVVVSAGGAYGTYVDLDGSIRSEAELVSRYREMSQHPECDSAVDEIINESLSVDDEKIVDINLDDCKTINPSIRKVITEEFDNCLKLLEFNKKAYYIYRRWYIDGRLYFHMLVDEKTSNEGIKEIRYIDPRKIRKVREVIKKRVPNTAGMNVDATMTKDLNEYYIYNDRGFSATTKGGTASASTSGLKIAKDSIVHVVSGLTDNSGSMVLSHLHKSIKALNQLRTLEDSLVIYRLSRAPERRIWYIDVGNLPKIKAEQYVRDIMVKHKNRLVYDANTGEIKDDRKFMTMLEDYWLPRREGGKGTEVTTLPGGQSLGQMDDVLYFQKKFLQSLNVPVSRLNSDALFSIGRATEITRDELKFGKFVARLRNKFCDLFLKVLERQLILKGIIIPDDWSEIESKIRFDFSKDTFVTELKNTEIIQSRIALARDIQDFAGKYYSHDWIRKNILKQTEEDIEEEDKLIGEETDSEDPRFINPMLQQLAMNAEQQAMGDEEAPPEDAPAGNGAPPEKPENIREKIRQATVFVKQMKEKGIENRSPQQQSKYKAAVQIIAKNQDVVKQLNNKPEPDNK